jgi:predicted AAA+ superfamily ATPase
MKYLVRTLAAVLDEMTTYFPVVLITGPRQVGKTTLLENSSQPPRTRVSLDDPQVRALAKTDPHLFLQTYRPPLLIDEVQYAPELFSYIKMIADTEKQAGMFWLTGSQQFQLMQNITETLAGRVAILRLQGLSQCERQGDAQRPPFLPLTFAQRGNNISAEILQIYEVILRGSYPALCTAPNMPIDIFYDSYIKTYLERDIRSLVNISTEHTFIKFMRVLAARSGQ